MKLRTVTAAAIAALALAGAACGEDNEDENPAGQPDAPVNTDTPSADPEGDTPAPDSEEVDPSEGN